MSTCVRFPVEIGTHLVFRIIRHRAKRDQIINNVIVLNLFTFQTGFGKIKRVLSRFDREISSHGIQARNYTHSKIWKQSRAERKNMRKSVSLRASLSKSQDFYSLFPQSAIPPEK